MAEKDIITNQQADDSLKSLKTGNVIRQHNIGINEDVLSVQDYKVNNSGNVSLSNIHIKILQAVVCQPMLSSTEYISLAGISPNTFSKIRPELLEKQFVIEHVVSSQRGRPRRLWQPTEKAIELVTKMDNRI